MILKVKGVPKMAFEQGWLAKLAGIAARPNQAAIAALEDGVAP